MKIKIFVLSPQSTKASEKALKPGDNALYVILKHLRKAGCIVVGNEVASLPGDKPLPLQRRAEAMKRHKMSNVSIIMGADTKRNVASWFPVSEAIQVPQPFFYITEPGRIKIELLEKIKEAYKPDDSVFGFNTKDKTIGGSV